MIAFFARSKRGVAILDQDGVWREENLRS
jgi:hypothetical protein